MKNRNTTTGKQTIISLFRIILGLVFIFSGFVKAVDPMGTAIKFSDYFNYAFNLPSLTPLSLPLSFLLCGTEFLIGLMLFFNIFPKISIWLAVLLMTIFTPLTLYLAIANPVTDCGCFGDAIKLTNWQTFWKDVVIDFFVIILFIYRNKIQPKYSSKFQKIFTLIVVLLIFGFELYNYSYLPIIDFRPYKVGANIIELSTIPKDAPQPVYKTVIVYKNSVTGQVKEFDEDSIPWQDTTWVWQETKSKLVKKGYVPPIHDFVLLDIDNQDITDSVLYNKDTVLLIVTYNLEDTKTKNIEKTKIFVDNLKSTRPHIKVFFLTSSDNNWINKIKQEEKLNNWQFCKIDETAAKTIIRSNPGVVIMYKGVILKKLHHHSLTHHNLKILEKL